jgi:hypothetical protein
MGSLDDLAALAQLDEAQEAPSSRPGAGAKALPDLAIEPYSGIRVKPQTRHLSRGEVESLAGSFLVRKLAEVPAILRMPAPATPSASEATWLTIGVLVDKGPAKPTARGDSFCVWKLSDLRRTTVSVFLFGEAFSRAWKELPGTVFAVLAPRTVPRKDGAPAGDGGALSIEKQQQLQRIGQASDFAFCKGERRDGKPCGMWVNRAECEYCEFHAAAALRQLNKASSSSAPQSGKRPGAAGPGAGSSATTSWQPPPSFGGQAAASGNSRTGGGELRPAWAAAAHPSAPQHRHDHPAGGTGAPSARGVRDAAEAAAQIAHAKAVLVHYGYSIPEPDPNSTDPFAEQRRMAHELSKRSQPSGTHPPLQQHKRRLDAASHEQHKRGAVQPPPHHQPPGVGRGARPQSDFAKSFGTVDVESSTGKRLLGARPVHAETERESARDGLDKRLHVLGKRDDLTEKAQSRACIDVTAHRCAQCDYFALRARPECKERGHDVRAIKVKQRGFTCEKCKQHATVLNKRVPDACAKCGANSWKPAGIRAEKASRTTADEFLPRGEEVGRFRNSDAPRPAMATISSSAEVARPQGANPNLWQAHLPVDG